MLPLPRLLAAHRVRRERDERRQHRPRLVAADELKPFEALVGEVDRVAAVDEHVIGDRREHHPLRDRQIVA